MLARSANTEPVQRPHAPLSGVLAIALPDRMSRWLVGLENQDFLTRLWNCALSTLIPPRLVSSTQCVKKADLLHHKVTRLSL